MNVAGAVVRGVSMMYATTVGNEDATASVMIAPDALHVKISIWPGVSRMRNLGWLREEVSLSERKRSSKDLKLVGSWQRAV